MDAPIIADELKSLPHVPIQSIEPLQGNLKTLNEREYKKLKNRLIDRGIIIPFFVWKEANAMLDGHQRQEIFLREGWLIDVPVQYVSAPDLRTAKQDLLAISSQYGKITEEGFNEFVIDLGDWPAKNVYFDAINFAFERLPDFKPVNEGDQGRLDRKKPVFCPECGHEFTV